MFGQVTMTRMRVLCVGCGQRAPLDAALNLPDEKHSHGVGGVAGRRSSPRGGRWRTRPPRSPARPG